MRSGPFVKIEMQDHGDAFLVTWSKGEVLLYRAFGDLGRAKRFAEAFIGVPLTEYFDSLGAGVWEARR
jgi:hypothetical protein